MSTEDPLVNPVPAVLAGESTVRGQRDESTQSPESSDERRGESALTDARCTTALQMVGAAGNRWAPHYNRL